MEGFVSISSKNEARSLFKKCFKNPMLSLVPFEIWRDLIVSNADLKSIILLSHSCFAFKKIVDNIGERNFNLALMLRKEGQIALALMYLMKCAENNNSRAMFHLGYAYLYGGWGLLRNNSKSAFWFKKSAENGNIHGIAHYAYCLRYGIGEERNEELSKVWAQKALSSNNHYAIGFCHYHGLELSQPFKELQRLELGDELAKYRTSAHHFELASKDWDEFAQYFLACQLSQGVGVERNDEKAFYWCLKSSEQGLQNAQTFLKDLYRYGRGCQGNKLLARIWEQKADAQRKNAHLESRLVFKKRETKF